MALSKSITLESGIEVQDSYARIDSRSGGNKGPLTISLNYYVNHQAFEDGKSFVLQEIYTFESDASDEAPNDIKQGYEYLKTLPEFEGATDVLEGGQ